VPPFQADTPHAYLLMHSQTQPRPIRDTNPLAAASPELEALVFRALEKDRTKRFATAREFGQALDALAPMLSDTPGAPAPLPSSSEVTNEATREAERSHDAATMVSIEQDAPTISANLSAAKKPLDRSGMEPPAAPSAWPGRATPNDGKARRSMLLPIAALLLMALGVGGWMMLRKSATVDPVVVPPVAQASTISLPAKTIPAQTVPQQGRLGINAFPWANVTRIRNLDNGQNVEIATLVTPAPVELAPGRYEVTLSNPQFKRPITRTVAIAAGEDETLNVTFRDPASAMLPDFGVTR
jgi:hypothetical protein